MRMLGEGGSGDWWCYSCFSDDIRKSPMDQFVMWIFGRNSSSSFFCFVVFFRWLKLLLLVGVIPLILSFSRKKRAHNQSIFIPVQTVKPENIINISHKHIINIVCIFGNYLRVWMPILESIHTHKQEGKSLITIISIGYPTREWYREVQKGGRENVKMCIARTREKTLSHPPIFTTHLFN